MYVLIPPSSSPLCIYACMYWYLLLCPLPLCYNYWSVEVELWSGCGFYDTHFSWRWEKYKKQGHILAVSSHRVGAGGGCVSSCTEAKVLRIWDLSRRAVLSKLDPFLRSCRLLSSIMPFIESFPKFRVEIYLPSVHVETLNTILCTSLLLLLLVTWSITCELNKENTAGTSDGCSSKTHQPPLSAWAHFTH